MLEKIAIIFLSLKLKKAGLSNCKIIISSDTIGIFKENTKIKETKIESNNVSELTDYITKI